VANLSGLSALIYCVIIAQSSATSPPDLIQSGASGSLLPLDIACASAAAIVRTWWLV
jgi:hypothetical protein